MRTRVAVLAVVSLVVISCFMSAADAAKEEAVKKDREAMKGDWTVVSVEADGKKQADGHIQGLEVRIDEGGKVTTSKGSKVLFEATFKIDPTKEPKTNDAAQTSEGQNQGKTVPGIYEIKGDSLRICSAEPGKDRPTGFSSKPGSGYTLRVLKRKNN